jgi:F-type H+-transporting ATPase subunit delta
MANVDPSQDDLDTSAVQLGRVYARALLGAAEKASVSDRVLEELASFVRGTLKQSASLKEVLVSPRISSGEKIRVLDRLLGSRSHPVLAKFLKVVAARERLAILPEILASAEKLRDEVVGRVSVEVRSATPLSDATRQSVIQRLGDAFKKQIQLRESVDPALLGGLVIRLGDTVYDASVAGRLDATAAAMREGFAKRLRSGVVGAASELGAAN